MSRRPRRNRPPRLDLPSPSVPRPGHSGPPSPEAAAAVARRALIDAHVTGSHHRLGRDAVRHAIRALTTGDRRALLGVDLGACEVDEVRAALVKTHGWDPESPRATIDPDATVAALRVAAARIREAAAAGARVAVATTRPAPLLGLAQWVAGDAAERGASLLTSDAASVEGPGRRQLWWIGDVAVVTDGQSLLAHDAAVGGDDWLFAVGRPDLVVADRGFAGAAVRAGVETIAWADLDAPALSVAAARGRPILVVPLDEQRPASAYDAVIRILDEPPPGPPDHGPHGTPDGPEIGQGGGIGAP
ncbi:MAG: phosphatase [Acidimicrobiia bacterium]